MDRTFWHWTDGGSSHNRDYLLRGAARGDAEKDGAECYGGGRFLTWELIFITVAEVLHRDPVRGNVRKHSTPKYQHEDIPIFHSVQPYLPDTHYVLAMLTCLIQIVSPPNYIPRHSCLRQECHRITRGPKILTIGTICLSPPCAAKASTLDR